MVSSLLTRWMPKSESALLKSQLAFGNSTAVVDHSLDTLRSRIARAVPGEFDLDVVRVPPPFQQAASSVKFGKLHLTASAYTPLRIDLKSQTRRTIVIPFSGDITAEVSGKTYVGQAGKTGLFFSGAPRVGVMDNGLSEILVELDSDYLLEVAQTMVDPHAEGVQHQLRLEQDRALALNTRGVSFETLYRNHCRSVDSLLDQPELLAMLGLDNAFYRSFVALLAPAIVFDADDKNADKRALQADALDLVCDYIQAHLAEPITLTMLERISGLSARSLQYAFQRRFECTPMVWVSRERLVLVRSLLQAPKEGTTVIRAAMQAGFRYPGTFAQDYRKRYGESPSATLKRSSSR